VSVTAARGSTSPPARRLLAGIKPGRALSLLEHQARLGPLVLDRGLIDEVDASGLRGRGGAAFDAATKLRAVAGQRRPVLVANAAEGEPASGKDKALLRATPQLVLDGVVAAAYAVGAREAVVAVAAGARRELQSIGRALMERRGDPVRVRIETVPDGFVTGEETALLSALQNGAPKPSLKPPYPFERGLNGAPTLVQNVETLAHIALIARYGADWFRRAGSAESPGTALITLGGAVRKGGVFEIELGSTLGDALARAGGATEPLAAVLVGGYFGRWVSADDAPGLRLAPEVLGAGAVVALPASACGVGEAARVVRYLAGESAGQCGPCVHGLQAIAGAFAELEAGPDRSRARLERWTGQVRGRGACRHPDGVATFVESFLTVFEPELARHARRGRCGAPTRGWLPVAGRTA
jgi:NADH:ubiquinone oxidoreductase subunit F (NADH-binding)